MPYHDRRKPKTDETEDNYSYYEGDHWKFWIGPRIPDSEPHSAEMMREVERVFQSVNLIRECIDRHAAALIGKTPLWYLKAVGGDRLPTKDEDGKPLDTPAAKAEIQLQRWLDATLQRSDAGVTDQSDPFWQAATDLAVCGKANFRLWQPERFAEDEDRINQIHLHATAHGSVEVKRGDDGFIDEIIYNYGTGYREIQRLDGKFLTITIDKNGTQDDDPGVLDTGGRWAISQMRSRSMLTPQIKQNQNAINHAATMLLRNQESAGFLERIFLGAQPPGEWVTDATAPGGEKFVPSDKGLTHGVGQDIFLQGLPSGDPSNPSYNTPSVVYREPIQVTTFLDSIAGFRTFIYHAFGQGHLLSEGDGGISGVSRIQLRQDFEVILTRQKRVMEAAIANTFNVVLKLLGYEGLEAVVQLRISTGKLSPEERKGVIEEFDKGLLSKATTIATLGTVEDVDAELSMIEEEREAEMQTRPAAKDDAPDPSDMPAQPPATDSGDENLNGARSNRTAARTTNPADSTAA